MKTPAGPQSLRYGRASIRTRRRFTKRLKLRARCRLQELGCAFAISDSRNGRRDGTGEIVAQRRRAYWRNHRPLHRRRLWNSVRPGSSIR